jgi:hypothetical protein
MSDSKKNWLEASKATHGDGNVGVAKAGHVKGAQSDSPIKTYGSGSNGQKAAKGTTQATKTPAVFGTKSGGSKAPAGGGKATFAKGLMQKKGK